MSTLIHELPDPGTPQLVQVARNVSTRYLAIVVETVVGLVMLPFNVAHLGPSAYGLWMLTASVTVHFSVLDLGYGGSLVKFIAQYRAHRNVQALNEIASTLFFVFAAAGCIAYLAALGIAFNLETFFKITPEQAQTGKWILVIIGIHVALNFPFSIYGGVVSGFQRYDANSMVAIVSSIIVALVNVAILLAGYGVITLVMATTAVRIVTYFVYRANAKRIFPALRIQPSLFRRSRLREVTGFSVYASIIDWANKLNYQLDQVVVGAFLGAAPVAVWAVAARIISATQRLTNQVNGVLLPVVVDSDTRQRRERLQQILLQGTRLSLVMVVPVAASLILLADPLIRAWVGPKMLGSVPVVQVLAVAVAIRVGNATGNTLLKGAGEHRMLAWVNLGTGFVNLGLSIALVKPLGLVGVAIGTLIPVAIAGCFILYPAACRRVGVPLRQAFTESIFPALWPAAVVGAALAFTRNVASGTLLAVVSQVAGGCFVYITLFFLVAIRPRDREFYLSKGRQLMQRRLASAA